MRITTKITWNIETGEVLEHEHFDYEGPLCLAGGGPSIEQRNAATQQASLSKQEADIAQQRLDREKSQFALVQPYYQNLLNNGLPNRDAILDFSGGTSARAWAPAYASLNKRFAADGLPSGSKDAAIRSIDAERARAYDQNLQGVLAQDAAARASGAAGLVGQQQLSDPSQWFQQANSGYDSIMKAPLATPGLGGVFGSLIGGLGGSAITAFCTVEGSLIMLADGATRRAVEMFEAGHEVMGRDGEPDIVLAKPESRIEECVLVIASNGAWGKCSRKHALMHVSGGFVRAEDALGQKVLTESVPCVITNVEPIGLQKVYQIRLKRAHAYCADGLWALE